MRKHYEDRVVAIKHELLQLAEIEAKLNRYVKDQDPGQHRDLAAARLRDVALRCDRCERELEETRERLEFLDSMERIKLLRQTPPIRPLVNFYSIDSDTAARAA